MVNRSPWTSVTTACHHPYSRASSAITRLPTWMSVHVLGSGLGIGTFSAAGTIFTELAGVVPGWELPGDPVAVLGLLLVGVVFGLLLVGLVMNLLLESKSG